MNGTCFQNVFCKVRCPRCPPLRDKVDPHPELVRLGDVALAGDARAVVDKRRAERTLHREPPAPRPWQHAATHHAAWVPSGRITRGPSTAVALDMYRSTGTHGERNLLAHPTLDMYLPLSKFESIH